MQTAIEVHQVENIYLTRIFHSILYEEKQRSNKAWFILRPLPEKEKKK